MAVPCVRGALRCLHLSPQAGRGEPAAPAYLVFKPYTIALPKGGRDVHAAIFTYSKSPGLLSMPTLGGAIHDANLPISYSGFISEAMNSPSAADGSQLFRSRAQVASSISTPCGVAWTSLNSPIWRWNATCGSASLKL